MKKNNITFLKELANELRFKLIEMSHNGKGAHLGSSLSCIDLIIACYWVLLDIDPKAPKDNKRDRFILSKGHAISSQYACLAYRGFFDKKMLNHFNEDGSSLPEHPIPNCVPGLEFATGSLGHGLAIAIGHALAGKILNDNYKAVVMLSDGECNEGSIWEGALFAPKKNLDNLIVIIDYNKWQATGRSKETLNLSPLKEKWEAFGWDVYEIDGNDMEEIVELFHKIKTTRSKPTVIVANTIKGKGVSFMEDDNNWHYRIPSEDEVLKAKQELGITL